MTGRHGTLEQRLWARVDKRGPDECWPWLGGRVPDGYGTIGLGKASEGNAGTHRVAWRLTNGEIPEGMQVCHRCDNRVCCNPGHMFLGTNSDNVADRNAKGRQARVTGERHGSAKLTEESARSLLSLRGTMGTSEAGCLFGISASQVRRIWSGERWSHLSEAKS